MTGEENLTLAGGLQTFVNQYTSDWGSLTAAAVIVAVPAAVIFGFVQRHLVGELTACATKSYRPLVDSVTGCPGPSTSRSLDPRA
ncbi:hypothetical protein SALBM135S_02735 [Streptomyces alboniger]